MCPRVPRCSILPTPCTPRSLPPPRRQGQRSHRAVDLHAAHRGPRQNPTAKEGQPKRDWLLPQHGYLASSRARHKVRTWFHKLDHEQNVRDGRDILERELKRLALTPGRIQLLLAKFHLASVDDLYLAAALGDLSPAQIARVVHEAEAPKPDAALILTQRLGAQIGPRKDKDAIIIEGVGNLLVTMAGCCNPVPGDAIVGFITKGRGVSVHRADCKSLLNLSGRTPERVIDVQWGGRRDDRYPVRIRVSAFNRTGLIRRRRRRACRRADSNT